MSKIYQKTLPNVKNPVKRNFGGFTLIELLVVVLIIGILAAIALPQYEKAVEKSRAAEAMVMIRAIADANRRYYMARGEYTNDLSVLDIEIPGTDSSYAGMARKSSKFFEYGARAEGEPSSLAIANRLPRSSYYSLRILADKAGVYCRGYTDEGNNQCKALGGVKEGESYYLIQ